MPNCQYKEQKLKAINKANQKAGWVLRTFKDRSIEYMRRMWRSLIQPHQDYCCVVWSPYSSYGNKGNIQAQEGPLRAFTKRAWGISEENYWNRLKKFKLSSIQRRVERKRCIYIWKMLN